MNRTPFLTLFFLSIWGCYQSNEIEFDVKSQTLSSSNNKGILRLYIENADINESYKIEWLDTASSPPSKINFQPLTPGFKVTTGYPEREVVNSKFNLKSNSFYIIERVQGDAASYKLMIKTDNRGLIDSVWR